MNRTSRATPTVGDAMTAIPRTISQDDSLASAWRLVEQLGVRHLPVTNVRGKLLGIVSERDLRVARAISEEASARTAVGEIMTTEPYTVGPDAPIGRVARTMASRRHGSAIVIDRGRILGIFTTTDALRALADAVEGKAPRVQASADAERRPQRPRTRRTIRSSSAA